MFPATSTRRKWNGTPFRFGSERFVMRCATVSYEVWKMRAMSSTSKSHRVRKGSAKSAADSGPPRRSFAPHCVSYTGMRSTNAIAVGYR